MEVVKKSFNSASWPILNFGPFVPFKSGEVTPNIKSYETEITKNNFSQFWFDGKRTVAGLSLGGEVVGWLVGWVGFWFVCTTSDSDTFQPFVAPASQDTRDKTAWKWHFSLGQPVCDIHRFETHSWQPFFPLRWQLTTYSVKCCPIICAGLGLTTCGGYWSKANHIRPWSHSTPSLASMSWGEAKLTF